MRTSTRTLTRRGMLGLGAGARRGRARGLRYRLPHIVGRLPRGRRAGKPSPSGSSKAPARPIGDGSTSYTGKQPHQPDAPVPLEPGQTPPQFVVFSWDGAGEVGNGLFPRFLDLAQGHGAHMTFFLSGLYLLPESRKRLYEPPNNPRGASDIGYLTDAHIGDTLTNVRRAWLDGGTRSAPTSTGTSAAAVARSGTGRRRSGAARSTRRSPS